MEDIKNSMDNIDLDEKGDVCICDLINNNVDIIKQMKLKIAELENMIESNNNCYCGRLIIRAKSGCGKSSSIGARILKDEKNK
jgi:hypothetical protein